MPRAKRTTQTTSIAGQRVRLVTANGKLTMTAAPKLEWELQAAQVRALRAMPEYGARFLLAGGMEAGRRGRQESVKAKATGLTAGHPDLVIFLPDGRCGMIENKNAEGRLSTVQKDRHAALARIGHHVVVIKAAGEQEAADAAVATVRGWLRDVQTLTLFVGNNRLQLEQFGAEPEDTLAGTPGEGSMAALMLRPIGTLSMIWLMLHGAMGTLGEAQSVERFEFHRMVVRPTLAPGRRLVKVAFDGEVMKMRAPLDIRVLAKPLYLLIPLRDQAASGAASDTGETGG